MHVLIVGAGLAGLTLASRLVQSGIKPVVIERERKVGGLARSFTYENGATFDIGPHRLHTDNPRVQQFVEETLGDDLIWIARNSQLYLFGKYLPWPITLRSVLSLPPWLLAQATLDLVLCPKAHSESLEDYILERYGKTLYRVFFRPYTERFLDYTCENLHRDWAQTGINRATIDKKLDTSSLLAVAKSVLMGIHPETKFIYPRLGGIGILAEKLADTVQRGGGRILLGDEVDTFFTHDHCVRSIVTKSGEEFPVAHVFWSGSLNSLRRLGDAPASLARLHYMSSILFNYTVREPVQQDFQWCYFGDKGVKIDRICMPRNFNPCLVPEGKDTLCVESSCSEESETWRDPTRLDCIIETTLLKARLLRSLDAIEHYNVEHIRETYPIYTLNYPRKLRATFEWVETMWNNLTLIGRTARFWYNNMDHSMAASLEVAERFCGDYAKGVLQPGRAYAVEDRYLTG